MLCPIVWSTADDRTQTVPRKAGKELMRLERPEQAAVTLDQAIEMLRGIPQVLSLYTCRIDPVGMSRCRAREKKG